GRGPLGRELLLRAGGDQDRHDDRGGGGGGREERPLPTDREHEDQDADDRPHRRDEVGQALLARTADVVACGGGAAQNVAARGFESKYLSGRRPSLRSTSSRRRRTVRWVTPAMMYDCIHENSELSR